VWTPEPYVTGIPEVKERERQCLKREWLKILTKHENFIHTNKKHCESQAH
jgi:hypothetical protein